MLPGRLPCGAEFTVTSIALIRSFGPSSALTVVDMPGPIGADRNSSARDQTTLTGRPGTARAMSTASKAASSAPLCP